MTVYAYNSADRSETLLQHVSNGLRAIELLYLERGYAETTEQKLEGLVGASRIREAIRKAYALHDLGKAYSKMQNLIARGRGARYHEVLSAAASLEILGDDATSASIVLAMLLHHHAMNELTESLKEAQKLVPQSLSEDYWDELGRVHDELSLPKPPETVTIKQVKRLTRLVIKSQREFTLALRQPPIRIILAYIVLHPLVTGDIIAATASTKKKNIRSIDDICFISDSLKKHVREFVTSRACAQR